jgi:hypothetical protein
MVLVGWIIIQGAAAPFSTSRNTHPSNFIKQPIEWVAEAKDNTPEDGAVNYVTYLQDLDDEESTE